MPYGLGVELTDAAVLAVVASSAIEREPVTSVPAVLFVDAGRIVVGVEALQLGEAQPMLLVRDVVGQFPVDRLWFAGGTMLTPDDAMRALLTGVVADITAARRAPPEAVTVVCPSGWDESACDRLRTIAGGLPVPGVAVMSGTDVQGAATNASLRLPETSRPASDDTADTGDLPPMQAAVEGRRRVQESAAPPEPVAATVHRRRVPGVVVIAIVIVLIVASVVAVARLADRHGTAGPASAATTVALATVPAASDALPTRALTLGLLSAGHIDDDIRRSVADLTAAGGVFGRDVVLVVQPATDDPPATLRHLLAQGASAAITDLDADRLPVVLIATAAANLALCATSAGDTPADGATLVVGGDARQCAEFLALAAETARSAEPAPIADAARELLVTPGIPCDGFAQCRAYVAGHQPITYRPAGEPIRLAP